MSAEDFGYDPGDAYEDATTDMGQEEIDCFAAMFFGERPKGQYACPFCWHAQRDHTPGGCAHCDCINNGTAAMRNMEDRRRAPLHPNLNRTGYSPTHRKDADTMAPKKLSDIENELRALESQAETLAARRAELERQKDARLALPAEPDLDAVIKFRVQHDPHGIVYTYIATRTRRNGAQWFTTSRTHPGPYTWDAILDLMQKDVGVKTGAATLEFFEFSGEGKWVR